MRNQPTGNRIGHTSHASTPYFPRYLSRSNRFFPRRRSILLRVKQALSPSPTPTCRQGIFVRHIPPPPEIVISCKLCTLFVTHAALMREVQPLGKGRAGFFAREQKKGPVKLLFSPWYLLSLFFYFYCARIFIFNVLWERRFWHCVFLPCLLEI